MEDCEVCCRAIEVRYSAQDDEVSDFEARTTRGRRRPANFARTPTSLVRRIFSPRGLDALQNRKAEEHNCTYCDPMRGHMQYRGSIDQPADYYQEADNVNPE